MRPHTPTLYALATLAIVTLAPAWASAANPTALLKYAPKDSGVIAGFDGAASRSSASFKEGFKLIKRDSNVRKVVRTLKKELDFDVSKDLDTGLFAAPALSGTGRTASRAFTLVVSGKIDRAAAEARLAKNGEKSTIAGLSVFSTSKGATVRFLDDNTVVIIAGKDAYKKGAWATVAGKAKGADSGAALDDELSRLDTSKHVWLAANTRKLKQPSGSTLKNVALAIDLSSGIKLASTIVMGSAGEVTGAIGTFEDNRFKSSMLLAAFSAHPLINNANLSGSGSTLTLATSMSDTQVRAVGARVREIDEQKRLQREEAKRKAKEAEANSAE